MRTPEQIAADAADQRPFSNSTDYEFWAGGGHGCYDCRNDSIGIGDEPENFCPILTAALVGAWPKEWTRRTVDWVIGDASGSYEVVDECTEFEERRDDEEGGDDPEPEPEPPPVIDGQIDIFEVFVDRLVEHLPEPAEATA